MILVSRLPCNWCWKRRRVTGNGRGRRTKVARLGIRAARNRRRSPLSRCRFHRFIALRAFCKGQQAVWSNHATAIHIRQIIATNRGRSKLALHALRMGSKPASAHAKPTIKAVPLMRSHRWLRMAMGIWRHAIPRVAHVHSKLNRRHSMAA